MIFGGFTAWIRQPKNSYYTAMLGRKPTYYCPHKSTIKFLKHKQNYLTGAKDVLSLLVLPIIFINAN
jgi:hypothetical protein